MARRFTDEERRAWQEKAGFQTTSSVIKAEREARAAEEGEPATRTVSQSQAEELMRERSGGGAVDVQGQMLEVLRDISRKLDNFGTLG